MISPSLLSSSVIIMGPWVMVAGCSMRLSAPPSDTARLITRTPCQWRHQKKSIIERHIDGLVQNYSNSSVLVMESPQPCTKPSLCVWGGRIRVHFTQHLNQWATKWQLSSFYRYRHDIVTTSICTKKIDHMTPPGLHLSNKAWFEDMSSISAHRLFVTFTSH